MHVKYSRIFIINRIENNSSIEFNKYSVYQSLISSNSVKHATLDTYFILYLVLIISNYLKIWINI